MDFTEGVGESSSPPRSYGTFNSSYEVRNDVFNRLIENGYGDAASNPELFRSLLDAHFNRLPASYGLDVNMDRVEDILVHQKLLEKAGDPEERPAYHVRFIESLCMASNGNSDEQNSGSVAVLNREDGVGSPTLKRVRDSGVDFEACSKLEDLNLEKTSKEMVDKYQLEDLLKREESVKVPIHEVIFSTIDKPKLLSQLSSLLSDIGLNIREAHVFSTIDGYSLDVFVVDGWPVEETEGLTEAMGKAIARSEGSWSGSSHGHLAIGRSSAQETSRDWEIDRRLLTLEERIASGFYGDLYHGVYLGQHVAIKILRSEHLTVSQLDEFSQEVAILREVQHVNVVRFIGACTKSPHLRIVTEYMPGGNLYDYLHRNHGTLKLSQLLKFAIDVSKGMQFRKLSSCYECHTAIDPRRFPSPRTTICACSQCGEIFPKPESLELHQRIRHAVSELGPEDSGRNIVEIIFKSSWMKRDSSICKIERILKVHNTQRTIQRFEDCRDAVKSRAVNSTRKNPRCAADGNELLRFYCTTLTCSLGARGGSGICAAIPACGVCTAIRHGFQGKELRGVRTTASSGRAHDSLVVGCTGVEVRRAMLVCRVIAGRVKRVSAAGEDSQEDGGGYGGAYDSVAGCEGLYSNYLEELFVFNPKAILPCFVVIYKAVES